jgi:hypothetical protein
MTSWLASPAPPQTSQIVTPRQPEASFASRTSQNAIGWSHLLKGRFSRHHTTTSTHQSGDDDISSKKFTLVLAGSRWFSITLDISSHGMEALICRFHGTESADKEMKRKSKLSSQGWTEAPCSKGPKGGNDAEGLLS